MCRARESGNPRFSNQSWNSILARVLVMYACCPRRTARLRCRLEPWPWVSRSKDFDLDSLPDPIPYFVHLPTILGHHEIFLDQTSNPLSSRPPSLTSAPGVSCHEEPVVRDLGCRLHRRTGNFLASSQAVASTLTPTATLEGPRTKASAVCDFRLNGSSRLRTELSEAPTSGGAKQRCLEGSAGNKERFLIQSVPENCISYLKPHATRRARRSC